MAATLAPCRKRAGGVIVTFEPYDVVIIGGGQAGIPLAFDLAEAGQRVALAERKHLGGSCVNFGCTPTKAAIASAKLAHQAEGVSRLQERSQRPSPGSRLLCAATQQAETLHRERL